MPNFLVTEYDTIVSEYRIEAKDRDIAIKKIANGDLITRAIYRAKAFIKDKTRRWYEAEEIDNEKKEEIQVIQLGTKD